MSLLSLFRGRRHDEIANSLYLAIVAQARRSEFYTHAAVPDTVPGRFDMVTLHCFLVMRRLKRLATQVDETGRADEIGRKAASLSQTLFDVMFADMDRNMREMGVGDLSVGKKVKKLAKGFYGRVAAYDLGLDGHGERMLVEALLSTLYGGEPADTEDRGAAEQGALAMADYMRAAWKDLEHQSDADLLAGKVSFPPFQIGNAA